MHATGMGSPESADRVFRVPDRAHEVKINSKNFDVAREFDSCHCNFKIEKGREIPAFLSKNADRT